MNKIPAFLFAIILTALIANSIHLVHIFHPPQNQELSIVARVIDGDTLELEDGSKVRLLNINSPEKSNPLYKKAFLFLKEYEGLPIKLEVTGQDKYGRRLARIYSPDNLYLNLESIKLGLSSKFLVQDDELSLFSKSEEKAIKEGIGIWEHSEYYSCITSQINPQEEIVTLSSTCGELNLLNFSLKDESRKEYLFHIQLSSPVTLHSSIGKDNATDIFWNQKDNVWNNDRDTLYLFDNLGKLVISNPYGY
ncbi:MAG: thermonuclease family protein [Nanoarchaeota archaeon]